MCAYVGPVPPDDTVLSSDSMPVVRSMANADTEPDVRLSTRSEASVEYMCVALASTTSALGLVWCSTMPAGVSAPVSRFAEKMWMPRPLRSVIPVAFGAALYVPT